VRAAPAILPASTLRGNVRAFDVERDAAAVMAMYERLRPGTTGLLARSDYWWRQRVWKRAPEVVVYHGPRGVEGTLAYEIPEDPGYPRQQVHVRDLHASSPEGFRGLIGFLEALGEQFGLVQLTFPLGQGVPLLHERGDAGAHLSLGILEPAAFVSVGAMARLVDVPAALALHPPVEGVRGRIGLDLEDPVFPSQRSFDLVVDGRVRASRGTSSRDRLAMSVDRLAQIVLAAAPASLLLRQGQITGSPRAAALLDDAFAGPRPYLGPGNFF
jgi:predicted acetyltransferase